MATVYVCTDILTEQAITDCLLKYNKMYLLYIFAVRLVISGIMKKMYWKKNKGSKIQKTKKRKRIKMLRFIKLQSLNFFTIMNATNLQLSV